MMTNKALFLITALAFVCSAQIAAAANTATGEKLVTARCAQCHENSDWEGETPTSLQALLKDVVSGKVKHRKAQVTLTEAEIDAVVAYWLTAKAKK